MNYRKVILVLFGVVSLTFAQSETMNIFGGVGFGFGTGGHLFDSYNFEGGAITKEENQYFNYGQGIKFDLGMQYFMMENIALQVSMGYSGRIPALETKNNLEILGVTTDSTTIYKTSLFGLKTLVVPRFEVLELLNMYTGVGVGFFWNSFSYEATRVALSTTQQEEGRIKSAPALALLGILGADFPLSDLMTAYGEVAFEQMSFKWTKKIVEKANPNASNIGTYIYEKDAPNQIAPPRIPGSNWQIKAGLRFLVF